MPRTPPPKPAPNRGGRPPGPEPRPPVTGVRIPLPLLARIDAIVAAREPELAARGGTTSRSALIIAALAEFCDREEGATRGRDGRGPAGPGRSG